MSQKKKPPNGYSKGALKLLETAEKLFGEQGIDGVSLRQIVSAAGLVNSYSIQHHFGSKEGLVQAVYDWRVPKFEEGCRRRLQAEEGNNGNVSIRGLLAARFLPLLDSFDAKTQKTYLMFLLRLLYRSNSEHPYFRSTISQPVSKEINQRLLEYFPGLPLEVFNTRFRLASDFFLGAVVEKQRLAATNDDPYPLASSYWDEILQAIETVFCVPYTGKLQYSKGN